MRALRQIRRRATSAAVSGAAGLAPYLPGFVIDTMEGVVARLGPIAPRLAGIVRGNMQSAGVYTPDAFRAYFRHAARHLTNGLRVFSHQTDPQFIKRLADHDVDLDATAAMAQMSIARTGGGLIAPAHCMNYLVSLVRLSRDIPVSIYLRWSKDPRKVELKRRWCEAAGLDVIIEPPTLTNPAARAELIINAVRSGKTVAITPDLAQRADEGVPLRWLDRIIYLPSGPASLAMLAEVPLLPLFARYEDGRQVLTFAEPIAVERLTRSDGGRAESVRRAMQTWTDGFETFVRRCPEGWFLWGDNRWTRVLQGNPGYSSKPDDANMRG